MFLREISLHFVYILNDHRLWNWHWNQRMFITSMLTWGWVWKMLRFMFGSILWLPWAPAKVTWFCKGQEDLPYHLFFIAVFMFLSESIYLEDRSSTLQSKKQLFLILVSGQQGEWPGVYVFPDTVVFHTCPSCITGQADLVAFGQDCLGRWKHNRHSF